MGLADETSPQAVNKLTIGAWLGDDSVGEFERRSS
jgi:hypothetical protein